MKLRYLPTLVLWLISLTINAGDFDQQQPFGFCTRTSRTSTDSLYAFRVTGGGCYSYPVTGVDSNRVVTLTSTGKEMDSDISEAIQQYDIIIFDGSQGDFIVSTTIPIVKLSNKTLLGINQARLCTKWHITQNILDMLNAAGVPYMSTSSGGGILTNGHYVREQAEYNTRQMIINLTGDNRETYRGSGIFFFNGCQNLIVRNLQFVGPGSIDVGGSDLVTFFGTKNSWVDHCDFIDGMDGNFDITQKSDFNTVSWCTFSYSNRSYMHQNTNLIGSSDREALGYLNTTFAFNHWGANCKARMPMARVGLVHMLNNYFTCVGCGSCVNPRNNSEFRIEGNYFAKGVKHYYSQTNAVAVTWTSNNYVAESGGHKLPSSVGATVILPYSYKVADCSVVPTEVGTYAGATLYK